jgi:hypothetical protein
MANNPSTEVSALLGGNSKGSNGLTDQLTTITTQLQGLQAINQSQMSSIEANTNALGADTSTKGTGGASTAGSIGNGLLDVLGFGTGLSPLISGIASLFGGGKSNSPATAVAPYIQPPSINLSAGFGGPTGGGSGVDYGEGGKPRRVTSTAATQITVQVQAMDSQSFLDRSTDIAAAVRKAMLETSMLNDVIRDV